MEDILVNTSPYSQLALATAVFAYGVYKAQKDDLGGQDDEMNIYEAKAWLEGREEEYQNSQKQIPENEDEFSDERTEDLLEE